jgi:hypothetical protein
MFTTLLPGNRRPIVPCICLAWTAQKTQFLLYCCHVLKGRAFTGRRCSSVVACIRCRENVYEHFSVVIETAHMSQYVSSPYHIILLLQALSYYYPSTYVYVCVVVSLFFSGLPTKTLHAFFLFPLRATCPPAIEDIDLNIDCRENLNFQCMKLIENFG